MGRITEYATYDALGLAALVRDGSVTANELLEEAIARTEAVNGAINAVVHKQYDEARAAIAHGLPDGPFQGVPFLLKNLYAMQQGTVTDHGSAFFRGLTATHDSTLVARYKAAGLVTFGKTNSPEFGLTVSTEPRLHGTTANPWDRSRSAGGSSGGASAAVAAGIVPMAHASDGGGSIRAPAAVCGLFGFKPTRARVPSGPDRGEGWDGMSHAHVISRSVRDSAAALDATHGAEVGDPYGAPPGGPFHQSAERDPAPLRVALVLDEPDGVTITPDVRAAVEETARLLTDLGHHVEPASLPIDYAVQRGAQGVIICGSTAAAVSEREAALGRKAGPDDLEPITHAMVAAGRGFTAEDYARASLTMHQLGRAMGRFHATYDVVLQATTATPPPPLGRLRLDRTDHLEYLGELYAFTPFLAHHNMTGAPSMSVPLGWTEAGQPRGVMLTGAFGADDLLFSLAGQLERAAPWAHRRPVL